MKNIAVILGHRINDDGTLTKTMYKRLDMALELDKKFDIDLFVVSGGVANKAVNFSEADAMYDYLLEKGMPAKKVLKEGNSMSTKENAIFTCKLLEEYDFENLIIVSTYGHFKDWNGLGFFHDAVLANETIKNKHINLMVYTNSEDYL